LKRPDVKCDNCSHVGHTKDDCWRKGGGKEGQGPHQKKNKSASAAAATDDYAFLTSTLSDSATVAAVPIKKCGAIVDSGASSHFCPDRNRFTVFTLIPLKPVKIANGQSIFATGKGDMVIELPKGNECSNITLKDTLYVPDIALTLISTTHIVKAGFAINMEEDWCEIQSPKPARKLVTRIPEVNGLYRIVGTKCVATATTATSLKMTCLTLMQLHECMGHIAFSTLKTMVSRGMIHGVEIIQSSKSEFCDTCVKAKITHLPFPNESKTRAAKYGKQIHTDVWGPSHVKSLSGKRYYISFMDDYSHKTTISFMKKKSEVYQKLMEHIAFVHTQHNATVKFIRSDRGGEYLPMEAHNYFAKRGIKHELTVHDSLQQNGVAEHTNWTLVENTCVMLFHAGFPRALWAEAISHATYLKNRSPTHALVDKTPYEKVHGSKPNLLDLHHFGRPIYVRVENAGKLDEQAKQAKFIGYDYNSKGYRVYWPKSRCISIERNVCFLPDDLSVPSDSPDVEFEGEDDTGVDSPTSRMPNTATHTPPTPADIPLPSSPLTTPPSTPPPHSTGLSDEPPAQNLTQHVTPGTKFPPGYYSRNVFDHNERINAAMEFDEEMGYACDELSTATEHADVSLESDEPSVEEAMRGPNAEHWRHAMDEEVAAIKKNGTWEIVDPPHGTNIIRSHFILKVKHNEKCEITHYKARLVTNGNTQQEGIDFNETLCCSRKCRQPRLGNSPDQHQKCLSQCRAIRNYLHAPSARMSQARARG